MPRLTRYFPPLAPDGWWTETEVADFADLDNVEWLREWSRKKGFQHFSVERSSGGRPLLYAQYENGPRVIVGHLSDILPPFRV